MSHLPALNYVGSRHLMRPSKHVPRSPGDHSPLPEELYSEDGLRAEEAVRRLERAAERFSAWVSDVTGAPPGARTDNPQPNRPEAAPPRRLGGAHGSGEGAGEAGQPIRASYFAHEANE